MYNLLIVYMSILYWNQFALYHLKVLTIVSDKQQYQSDVLNIKQPKFYFGGIGKLYLDFKASF